MIVSYLVMPSAPVSDASKAIISLWFRASVPDPKSVFFGPVGSTPGPNEDWDMAKFPPPPNPNASIPPPADRSSIPANGDVFIFYNPYGEPQSITAEPGPNAVIHPLIPVGRLSEGGFSAPVVTHDQFNVLMSFGNPDIPFQYRPWITKKISTMDGVVYVSTAAVGVFVPFDGRPLPYDPYFHKWGGNAGAKAGQPIGNDGLVPCVGLTLGEQANHNIIPQSFIGVDKSNYLRIFLQTNQRAEYKGYAFSTEKAKELMMYYSRDYATPAEIAAGITRWGYWGPVWAGWEFEYKDISTEMMTQWPEYFMFQGPKVADGWNHLLFSFDIDGAAEATLDALPDPIATAAGLREKDGMPMFWLPAHSDSCTTRCQAWMTLNNVEQTHFQNPFPLPAFEAAGGLITGGLPGANPQYAGGRVMWALTRQQLRLGPNDIVPQNVFATSVQGLPRYATHQAFAAALDEYIDAGFWSRQETSFGTGLPSSYRGGFGFIIPVHNGKPASPVELTVPNPKTTFPKPSYKGGPFSIPIAEHPIGLPTSSSLVLHNMGCDQAELQIWVGQSANTESIKRLFITADGKPTPMQKAWDALGKPQIALHGTGNWKKGKNTGKAGGRFTPVAKIEKFTPDPVLKK